MQPVIDLNGFEEAEALKIVEKFEEVSDFELSEKENSDRFENTCYEQNSDWLAQ